MKLDNKFTLKSKYKFSEHKDKCKNVNAKKETLALLLCNNEPTVLGCFDPQLLLHLQYLRFHMALVCPTKRYKFLVVLVCSTCVFL